MNRRGVWVVMLVTALAALVCMPRAWGQMPPETHPVSTTQDIVRSWDRSAMPGEIELWSRDHVMGYSLDPSVNYGGLHITCTSGTDSSLGACPMSGEDSLLSGIGLIKLNFRESRTGTVTELSLQSALLRGMPNLNCGEYWISSWRFPWSARKQNCAGYESVGTAMHLILPTSEAERLVAGNWSAALTLHLREGPAGGLVATYIFNVNLTITDHNAVSIYFPQYESTTPLVNLDARYDPIRQTLEGRVVVDMCLYDGLGSQASYLAVTARDTTSRPPGPSGFSLWHETSGSDDSQRLDYTITLDHNGTPVPLANGVEERLGGIDSARLRLVMLPGMSQPVFCVPTPMTLDMPRVPSPSKRPGTYWGDLTVELRVPAAVP